jgi:hypothetical protein
MVGVVGSRFLDFLLRRLRSEDKIKSKIDDEQDIIIESVSKDAISLPKNYQRNLAKEKIDTLIDINADFRDKVVQELHWKELLWIIFSFIIAVLVFSSFKTSVTLSNFVLVNVSLAFAFGFTFDRTLEMATRFKSIYTSDEK